MAEPKDTIEHWIAKPEDLDRAVLIVRSEDESNFTEAQQERMRDLDIYLPRDNGLFKMRSELSVNGNFVFQKASGVWTQTMAKIMRDLRLKLITENGDSYLEDADMNAVIPHGNDDEEPWRITNWKVESKDKDIDGQDRKVFIDKLRWETTVNNQPFKVDTFHSWRGY